MANIFRAKSLISRTGVFSNEVIAPNLIYNTGDQNISGNKTFINNINVSGSGIFNALDLNNIDALSLSGVDISIINGNIALTNRPTVNGTGVVLSGELNSTGILLNNRINSLSGSLNSSGSNLNNSINSLSGLFTGFTGTLDATFASDIQLANTGSTLVNSISSLSGTLTSTYATITNLASTGATLTSSINSLSGTLTGNYLTTSSASTTYATITNLASTGSTLVGSISSLSGTLTSTYATITNLASTGSTLNNSINSLSGTLTSTYATINNLASTGSTLQTNINNLSNTYATITNLASTGTTLDTKIGSLSGTLTSTYATISNLALTGSTLVTNLASTGSTLDTKINTLSGYVTGTNSTFTTNLASTGSTLNTKINNLSGYINSTSSNIVFTTGNQTISGVKTFVENATFGDTGQGDFLVISGNNFTVYGSGNFTSGLFVNGNAVLTGVNLSSYATTANLALTGSTLDNKISSLSGTLTNNYATITNLANTGSTLVTNLASTGSTLVGSITSLSGLFTGYTGALDVTFASDIQLANTGSTLVNSINSLSGTLTSTYATITNVGLTGSTLINNINSLSGLFTGYTGSLDATFASDIQLANTGSALNTKINDLSGVSVLTFGNQTINGIKTFTTPNVSGYLNFTSGSYVSGILNPRNNLILSRDTTVTTGAAVSFVKTGNLYDAFGSIALTRGAAGPLYNYYTTSYFGNNTTNPDWVNPRHTKWNRDGWSDLTNIRSRKYDNFVTIFQNQVGLQIVDAELIMWDTTLDNYYLMKFSYWQGGGGGNFTYVRSLVSFNDPEISKISGYLEVAQNASFDSSVTFNSPTLFRGSNDYYGENRYRTATLFAGSTYFNADIVATGSYFIVNNAISNINSNNINIKNHNDSISLNDSFDKNLDQFLYSITLTGAGITEANGVWTRPSGGNTPFTNGQPDSNLYWVGGEDNNWFLQVYSADQEETQIWYYTPSKTFLYLYPYNNGTAPAITNRTWRSKNYNNSNILANTGEVVLLVGDQTISGVKTFIGNHNIIGNTIVSGSINISGNYDIYSQIENAKKLAIAYAIAL